jgi:glycosyltransferase involved in cell wall biosynthesis
MPVSVIIPVHNGETYLAAALASALDQTRPPIECIVVDDGSQDATPEIVRNFGKAVSYVRQPRRGVSTARNHGARIARGALLAFLDHDDAWRSSKLERQSEELGTKSMILCAMTVVDSVNRVLGTRRLSTRKELLTGMLMFDGTEIVSCSSTGLVRREWFLAQGGFDERLSVSADWDLLLRTVLDDALACVDEPLVLYRVHSGNMSRDIVAMANDMTYAFDKAFADPRLPAMLRARRGEAYARMHRMLAGSHRQMGSSGAAVRSLLTAIRYDPRVLATLRRRQSFGRD